MKESCHGILCTPSPMNCSCRCKQPWYFGTHFQASQQTICLESQSKKSKLFQTSLSVCKLWILLLFSILFQSTFAAFAEHDSSQQQSIWRFFSKSLANISVSTSFFLFNSVHYLSSTFHILLCFFFHGIHQ